MIDLQVGDDVICVQNPSHPYAHPDVKVGERYRVATVFVGVSCLGPEPAVTLVNIHTFPMIGFAARSFRKVSPKSASEHIERLKRLPVNDLEEV